MAPGANCPLVVRFCPKALGQHQASLSVQVLSEATSRVIAEVPFQAVGLCRQLGSPRRPLPGGPMALPESFVKPKQFVDPEKASFSSQHNHMPQSDACNCMPTGLTTKQAMYQWQHALITDVYSSLVILNVQALPLQKQCRQHLLLSFLQSGNVFVHS